MPQDQLNQLDRRLTVVEERVSGIKDSIANLKNGQDILSLKIDAKMDALHTAYDIKMEALTTFIRTKVFYLFTFIIIVAIINEKYLPVLTKFLPNFK